MWLLLLLSMLLLLCGGVQGAKKHQQRLPPPSLRRPKIPSFPSPVFGGRHFHPVIVGGAAGAQGGGAGAGDGGSGGGGGGDGPLNIGGNSAQEGMPNKDNVNMHASFALLMLFDAFMWYSNKLVDHPIITKVLSSMVLGLFGDWCCQKLEGKKKYDVHRLFIFAFLQGLYVAPVVHYWFSFLSNLVWLPISNVQRALTMMAIDQTVGVLSITVGLFFAFELVSLFVPKLGPLTITRVTLSNAINKAVESCRTRLKPVLLANWTIWPVISYINFVAVPEQYRVLFVNCFQVVWNIYLSKILNAKPSTVMDAGTSKKEDLVDVLDGLTVDFTESAETEET